MSWLLDTCVLSEYAKKPPSPKVIAWLDEQDEASLFISVISIGEIEKGILKLRDKEPRRSQKLTAWLGKVEQRFARRILPPETVTLHVWAQIAVHTELPGKPLPVMDGLVRKLMGCRTSHGHCTMPRPHCGHPQRTGFRHLPAGF